MDQLQRTHATPSPEDPRRARSYRRLRRRRVRRIAALVVLFALIPIGWSYARALTAPGSALPVMADAIAVVSARLSRASRTSSA